MLNHALNGNGIANWLNIKNEAYFRNGITIGKVDAKAFYQPYKFVCSSDVNVIQPKNYTLNKFSALFICNQIRMQSDKFDYGNQIRLNDTIALNIMLPIDVTKQPDYPFMEKYMEGKENEILERL
ncbi:restriction endonuclease subunit S [Listeria sp. PSOL-1]|uniref:restriction endonuclease subunit S n=1 Tax=Listeria sp. PSOL-1 TaxID=1844999 RepID=UPI001E60EB8A|nr:restriction endonuclease subunit S [Listeria sp. PSOL-1]